MKYFNDISFENKYIKLYLFFKPCQKKSFKIIKLQNKTQNGQPISVEFHLRQIRPRKNQDRGRGLGRVHIRSPKRLQLNKVQNPKVQKRRNRSREKVESRNLK